MTTFVKLKDHTLATHCDLPDGSWVQICSTGLVYGPESPVRISYGTSYLYWRSSRSKEWQRVGHHSAKRVSDLITICDTIEEFESNVETF